MDNLGDQVLGTGLLRSLRSHYPRARLLLAVPERLAGLYQRCPLPDMVLPLPSRHEYPGNEEDLGALAPQLASLGKADLVVNPRFAEDDYAAGPLCSALAAPGARIIGFRQTRTTIPGYDPNAFYTELVQAPESLHTAQYARLIANAVIGRDADAPPETWFEAADWERVAERWLLEAGQFVVVGVGASSAHKVPAGAVYVGLLDHLLAGSHRVVLAGDANEAAFADSLIARVSGSYPTGIACAAGELSLPELAALLARAKLYIGPDAGPKHMAAAAGTPVVEISPVPADYPSTSRGPTAAGHCWRPWNTRFRSVHPDREAFARTRDQASFRTQPIPGISSQALAEAVEQMLA